MKTLIIGINGFLGTYVALECRKRKWSVDGMHHLQKGHSVAKNSWPVEKLEKIPKDYDIVFLLAAKVIFKEADNHFDKELILSNIELPLRVAKHFVGSHIVYSSSVSVYGNHHGIVKENSSFEKPGPYGLSKSAGETVLNLHKSVSVIRLGSFYGKGMNSGLFIAKIIKDAAEKGRIDLVGQGKRLQDYLYVEDAARLCAEAGEKRVKGTFLGVYGRSYANSAIAEMVAVNFKNCKIRKIKGEEGQSYRYDNSQTRGKLKFKPQFTPAQGIAQMIKEIYG